MTIYGWLIPSLWLTLVVHWVSSASVVRRRTGRGWIWWREIAVRLAFFALVVLAFQLAVVSHALPTRLHAFNTQTLMGFIGFVFSALGIGLAILGRIYLGRNRGIPMSNKEGLELVTTGPYAFVRHPIYGGMILAMFGSAIGQSVFWLLPLVAYGPFFIRSARSEERLCSEQFPERYRAYQKRTKMLLPFVL
jgi:protein-S-isoprenylcysteine O-methyltransferase Ste14